MWESKRGGLSNKEIDPMKPTKRRMSIDKCTLQSLERFDDEKNDDVSIMYKEASILMALPEPYVTQLNKKFILVEDHVDLTEILKSERFQVDPCGYYRTPDGFDIYVFECTLGTLERPLIYKKWKIHRRYRHFDLFLARLTETNSTYRGPSLSGSYLQMFRAKHCKDRLVELHTWLQKTVQVLQTTPDEHELFIQLCSFLFASANTPYLTFPSLPPFAWAHEEINIELINTSIYPSKIRSSKEVDGGLGIRLVPNTSRMEEGIVVHRGAVIKAFLRETYDNSIRHLRIGALLARINGVAVEDQEFQNILLLLRNVTRPMYLAFTFDPRPHFQPWNEMEMPRHERLSSMSSMYSHGGSSSDATEIQSPMNVLGSVLNDTLSRKRTETISITTEDHDNQDEEVISWDDVGGFVMDTVTSGFFTRIPSATKRTINELGGVWNTTIGPMGIVLTACKLRGQEAIFLSTTPRIFNKQIQQPTRRNKSPEMRLERGMVLISINKATTFGLSFKKTLELLEEASQPTVLCFRWFNEYSLFLSPHIDAVDHTMIHRPSSASEPEIFPNQDEITSLMDAQARMCTTLHQTMNENASLRSELSVFQESNRLLQEENRSLAHAYEVLTRDAGRVTTRCNDFQAEIGMLSIEIQQTTKERNAAEKAIHETDVRLQQKIDAAREISRKMIQQHEEKCIEESRKSILVAKHVAETKAKRQVEEALASLRRQNNVEMQRLAEDNGEEIEFLNQQLALWKHQVEVLTENERRKRPNEPIPRMSDDNILYHDEAQDRRAGARVQSTSRVDGSNVSSPRHSHSLWGSVKSKNVII